MKNLVLLLTLILAPSIYAASTWNLNDISYLFDVPRDHAELLKPTDLSKKGALLPSHVFRKIPVLLNGGSSNNKIYSQNLRVVSVRVDACPSLEVGNCHPELRLVWQPIRMTKNGVTSDDTAVHTFYKLENKEFNSLKKKLWMLKKTNEALGISTHKKVLNIHPAFSKNKKFLPSLKNILLEFSGEKNFHKITFMSLLVPTRWWRFGAFERQTDDSWKSPVIPRLTDRIEDLFNTSLDRDANGQISDFGMDAIINIFPTTYPKEDIIFGITSAGFRFEDDRDLPVFKKQLDAVARFRNPHKTNPDILNCSSCHFADATKGYAERRFPSLKENKSSDEFLNPNKYLYDLKNTTKLPTSARIVRAFGFFDNSPAINQRVINDSAVSAEWMNKFHKIKE